MDLSVYSSPIIWSFSKFYSKKSTYTFTKNTWGSLILVHSYLPIIQHIFEIFQKAFIKKQIYIQQICFTLNSTILVFSWVHNFVILQWPLLLFSRRYIYIFYQAYSCEHGCQDNITIALISFWTIKRIFKIRSVCRMRRWIKSIR